MAGVGAFWGARVMEIVKKHDSGGLVWKRIKLTTTRKANAKKRLLRVWQNEAVLKACAEQPPARPTDVPGDVAFQNDHGKEASHLRRLILASLIEQQPEISLTL